MNRRIIIIAVASILPMIINIFAGAEQEYNTTRKETIESHASTSAEIKGLSAQIKQLVRELEYSDKVAHDVADMVSGWEDAQENPFLGINKKRLGQAKEQYRQGNMSKEELSKIELNILVNLIQKIKEVISYDESSFDLGVLTEDKKTNCLGYVQLMFVLGNTLEISTEAVEVKDAGERIIGGGWGSKAEPLYSMLSVRLLTLTGHIVCLLSLTDETKVIVDVASYPEGRGPFKFERMYKKNGIYWEIINPKDIPLFYKKIRKLDKNGLIANIRNSRSISYLKSKEYERTIRILDGAIGLDPEYSLAYLNRGHAYSGLGKLVESFSDYTKAIELDPEDAVAYNSLGELWAGVGDYEKALEAYRRALKCDSNFAQAQFNAAEAFFEVERYLPAIWYYHQAAQRFGAEKFWSGQEPMPQPVLGYIHYKIGEAWYKLKIYYQTGEPFATALELDPSLKNEIEKMLKLIQAERSKNFKQLSQSDIAKLIDEAKGDDVIASHRAFESLVTMGGPAVPALIKILEDKNASDIHGRSINALAAISPVTEEVVPTLIKVAGRDPHDYVEEYYIGSYSAEKALVYIGLPAVPALQKALNSEDENLRKMAKGILEEIENKRKK